MDFQVIFLDGRPTTGRYLNIYRDKATGRKQKKKQKVTGKKKQGPFFFHAHTHIHAHTCAYVRICAAYMRIHAHICAYMPRKKKVQRVETKKKTHKGTGDFQLFDPQTQLPSI